MVEYNPRAHSDVIPYKRIFLLFLHRVRQPESSPQGGVLTGKYAYMCTLTQYSSRLMIFINYDQGLTGRVFQLRVGSGSGIGKNYRVGSGLGSGSGIGIIY